MKICFLAPSNSAHTKKWCRYFISQGHEVHVVSFCDEEVEGAYVHYICTGASTSGGDAQKLKYLTKAGEVRKVAKQIAPDVINVHYATSYGTVAALAGLKNYALSVWGSDVYDFPKKSPIHRVLLKFSLSRAKYIFSTSMAMARETNQYTPKQISITPFGVDVDLFSPSRRTRGEDGRFVVGTIKALNPKYGIEYLLKAAALVRQKEPQIPLCLRIAGKGPYAEEYRAMSQELGIGGITNWLGFISQEQAAVEWANMDLAVVPSTLESESFGVSAVEAESCGCPVIISDIPGLMEATKPGVTSMVVPRMDENALADAIISLYHDPERRKWMGEVGRQFALENYALADCFGKIEGLFQQIAD